MRCRVLHGNSVAVLLGNGGRWEGTDVAIGCPVGKTTGHQGGGCMGRRKRSERTEGRSTPGG